MDKHEIYNASSQILDNKGMDNKSYQEVSQTGLERRDNIVSEKSRYSSKGLVLERCKVYFEDFSEETERLTIYEKKGIFGKKIPVFNKEGKEITSFKPGEWENKLEKISFKERSRK